MSAPIDSPFSHTATVCGGCDEELRAVPYVELVTSYERCACEGDASKGNHDQMWHRDCFAICQPVNRDVFTSSTTLESGLYLSMPQGHARISDGHREITVSDGGGSVSLGGIWITDPEILDGLGDHLKLLAERRRRDIAEPYRPGAPPADLTHEPKPPRAAVVDVALPEPQLSLDLPA